MFFCFFFIKVIFVTRVDSWYGDVHKLGALFLTIWYDQFDINPCRAFRRVAFTPFIRQNPYLRLTFDQSLELLTSPGYVATNGCDKLVNNPFRTSSNNFLWDILSFYLLSWKAEQLGALSITIFEKNQSRGLFQYRWHLVNIGNFIVEIRRSYKRLTSKMGFPILVRWHLYIQ